MSDEMPYGLGALPEVPDERDYPVSALYAAEGIVPSVALPATYAAPLMPPVLDQKLTPMCIAYSLSAMKSWQDRQDQEQFFDFDEPLFFGQIGGTAYGAFMRDGFERMLNFGYPVLGGAPSQHRITAYYTVPRDIESLKQAIHDLGPIVVITPWYSSWFYPSFDGVLPKADRWVGYHAVVLYGWDARGMRARNSWGSAWGYVGDFFLQPYLLANLSGAWKAVDAIEHPISYAHTVQVTASPLNIRKGPGTRFSVIGTLSFNTKIATVQLEKFGGKYVINGVTRNDWLQVSRQGWIARGWTKLVK